MFSELKKYQIPSNYELYLFWNNSDEVITNELQESSICFNNVHLAPSHLINCKNSADGKLIYFLGKLAKEFDFITIVGGGDGIYEEVIEAVKYDYPQKPITLKKIQHPSSSELKNLLDRSRCNVITRSIHVVPNQKIKCPECPNRIRFYLPDGLREHLSKSRKHSKKIIEVSKDCTNVKKNIISCPKEKVTFICPSTRKTFENSKKGKKCPLCPTLKQKYKAISLYNHLKEKHPIHNKLEIQCCNKQVTYCNLDEFLKHITGDPFEITYKISA